MGMPSRDWCIKMEIKKISKNIYEIPSIVLALLDYIPSDNLLEDSDLEIKD